MKCTKICMIIEFVLSYLADAIDSISIPAVWPPTATTLSTKSSVSTTMSSKSSWWLKTPQSVKEIVILYHPISSTYLSLTVFYFHHHFPPGPLFPPPLLLPLLPLDHTGHPILLTNSPRYSSPMHNTTLHCQTLYCTSHHYTALHCTALYCTAP